MSKILVVDDDKEIASLIGDSLYDEGYEVLLAYDGEKALSIINKTDDLSMVILDIMMPKIDGLSVCKTIREKINCPILFVSAKSRTLDTLLGLEIGADDYIKKPFIVEELVARVKAHIRREQRKQIIKNNIINIGDIEVHKDSYEVYVNKKLIELSTREFQLFLYLCENVGKVLSREQIFDAVWGMEYGDIGTVAVNIKSLRDKIDKENKYIKTIWGVGYKFIKPINELYEN
ncbi:response regulator transcription factor [Romboutsia sp. CE17]|uniref:response regulator transcription factor n=1 Tax=Romboutsia sp. CE17 TaxID=2724150 RepID=UPI001442CB91|nr:response regulator transcription factor [Romboutsia sp. CE17]QJA08692.1 response regulator transcription factor [Romboutsia sp. CE17]